jgi:hypothetical protein
MRRWVERGVLMSFASVHGMAACGDIWHPPNFGARQR